jgi:hypothetical protein
MYLLFICQKGRIRRAKKFRIWPQDSDPTADSFYHSRDPAQDLEQLREFDALFAEKGYCEETVRAARPNCLNMIVVKLNSGGLLLYCPVQVPLPVFCTPPFSFPVTRELCNTSDKSVRYFSVLWMRYHCIRTGYVSGFSISSESG